MAIRLLDKHTTELIAAGEVVERPSSVVKELCENAIDAKAKNIAVEIERGGIAQIRIQDDGAGIAAEDIPLAFVSHATSKVQNAEDLEHIATLGFRGEALASIASVARVELLTMTSDDEFAHLYRIEGGQELEIEAAARSVGTTITVRDLFYNTPARMKFLKKDASEGTFVTETVTRLALSHPEIAFTYTKDGKTVFATPGGGDLQATVYAVLGKAFAKDLITADYALRQHRIWGLVTLPRASRASRSMQYFFINGRFVKNRTMMAALEQAYRGTTMHGKFPGCVLFLQMPPSLVDVNVHPAKIEVRFAREGEVFDTIYVGVKQALTAEQVNHASLQLGLAAGANAPAAKEEKQPCTPDAALVPDTPIQASPKENASPVWAPGTQPATSSRIHTYNQMIDALASDGNIIPYTTRQQMPPPLPREEWRLDVRPEKEPGEDRADIVRTAPTTQPSGKEVVQEALPQQAPTLKLIGEVFKTYILAQWDETLCLIDKHAAHERLLYEQLAEGKNDPGSQQLLAPVAVALSAKEKNALMQNTAALKQAGVEVEDFGGNEVLVRGVPADIQPDSISDMVVEIANRLAVNDKDTATEKSEWVLHSMACRAAVKAGDRTRPEELLRLAQAILEGEVPPFCPHGRPVVLKLTRKEIEKQFGRLG